MNERISKQVIEVLLIYKRRISNGSSEIRYFSLEYRSGKLQVGKKEIEKEVTFERRPLFSRSFREREEKNSLGRNPERRIIPPYVQRRPRVSINLRGCSTSTTIMVTPMLRVPDNYYKKWRPTPGVPSWKRFFLVGPLIETSNLSVK